MKRDFIDRLAKSERHVTPAPLDEIKHIGEPQKIITPHPDQGDEPPSVHPVQALLERIAVGVEYLRPANDESDGLFPIMKIATAAAGRLSVSIATERPYILISGVNGAQRNLMVYAGNEAQIPIGYIAKGKTGSFTMPFATDLTIDYDAGAGQDEIYICMSSRPVNFQSY